jgi:mono/diheme cytochrome c family protein
MMLANPPWTRGTHDHDLLSHRNHRVVGFAGLRSPTGVLVQTMQEEQNGASLNGWSSPTGLTLAALAFTLQRLAISKVLLLFIQCGGPMRIPVTRFFLFSFTLCGAMQLWLAGNWRVAAQQNKPRARIEDQTAIVPLDGTKIFRNYCAACHGINGSGDGPAAPALKTKPPELTTIARRNGGTFPTARVRSIIAGGEVLAAHGSREMPIWGPIFHQIENDQDLGYVRLQNVTEYLKSIQRK